MYKKHINIQGFNENHQSSNHLNMKFLTLITFKISLFKLHQTLYD